VTPARRPTAWARLPAAAGLLLAGLLAMSGLPGAARAQPVTVTAGEHRGFTRLVLQSPRAFDWQVEGGGAQRRVLVPERELRLDAGRIFHRIPRTRLADIRLRDGGLELSLACACPVRAWADRPGVVVLDIADPGGPIPEPVAAPDHAAAPVRTAPPPPDPGQIGWRAGRALAEATRQRAADAATGDNPDAASDPQTGLDPGQALAGLAAGMSQALTRGLVVPAVPAEAAGGLLAEVAPPIAPPLPPNLRLRGPDEPDIPPADPVLPGCPSEAATRFLRQEPDQPLLDTLSRLRGQLYGEFDQPDPEGLLRLSELYLAWGFGAEARQILDNLAGMVDGRDLLLGLADLLDDRQSNARLRLAGLIHCPAPVPLLAALAGAAPESVRSRSLALVPQFQTIPAALRLAIGPQLVERLLGLDAVDAARMVLESLERIAPRDSPDVHRLAAALDRARGQTDRAAQRLDATAGGRLDALQLRLEIALERAEPLPSQVLDDAAVLAEAHRGTETGRAILELVIRHHAAGSRPETGLAWLDRMAGWLEPTPSARARLAALRDLLWQAAADLPDDRFLGLILSRSDWRDPDLDAPTRARLADRFATLGLGSLIEALRASVAPERGTDVGAADARGPALTGAPGDPVAQGQNPSEAADNRPPGQPRPGAEPSPPVRPGAAPQASAEPEGSNLADLPGLATVPAALPAPPADVTAARPAAGLDPAAAPAPDPAPGNPSPPAAQRPPILAEQPDQMSRGTAALAEAGRLRELAASLGLGGD